MPYTPQTWADNDPTKPLSAARMNYIEAGIAAAGGGGAGSDTTAVHFLQYDTTGVSGASSALQTAIDAGNRNIVIPPGVFKCDAAVFDDLTTNDANATLLIQAYGVRFEATTSLPTVAEFESLCSGSGFPTGAKWFFFPNTLRSALSGGVVTATNNFVTPTYQSRVPVNPRVIFSGGAFSAINLTKYNAGFCYGNRGGAVKFDVFHMSSARALLAWTDYVDGNSAYAISAWGAAVMDATYDAWMFWCGSGDGITLDSLKTDNYIGHYRGFYNNGTRISSTVGGGFEFYNCHGVMLENHHTEQDADIGTTLRRAYYIKNSHVIIDGGQDYTTDSLTTTGLVYLDDDMTVEGSHSHVELRNFWPRDWFTTSDPSGGWAIYINNMADASRIRCRSSVQALSTSGNFFFAWGKTGLKITGNLTNEPSLTRALNAGRDVIATGDFDIVKRTTSTLGLDTGQGSKTPIAIANIGNLSDLRQVRSHAIPTFYNAETSSNGTGTLTNAQLYSYTAAICNTLPDTQIQYAVAPTEFQITAGASGVAGFELYCPSAAHGASLVIWRKTGTGVVTAPDRYVIIPINATTTRFVDTGVNINKYPWLTKTKVTYVKETANNTKNSAGTTLVLTVAAAPTAGNRLVMRVVGDSGVAVSSIADSRSNAWTVDVTNSTAPKANICSTAQNTAALQAGDTITITFNGSCTQAAAIVDEFFGAGAVDKTATGTASGTNRSAGTTATLTQADELVIGCFALGAVETIFTAGSNFADFTTPFLVAAGTSIEGEYQIVSATTAITPTATGASNASDGATATYLAAAIPIANTVAASNHTSNGLYLGTAAITIP